jgi:acyl-coenzyme A synthetase/AMP-(fatty) acid ligase
VQFVPALPRNSTGKVLKFQLRKDFARLGHETIASEA